MRRIEIDNRQSGFTLVEIIITLVIMAYTGAMLFQFMNTTIHVSHMPLNWVEDEMLMGNVLEDATADYVQDVNGDTVAVSYTGFEAFLNTLSASIPDTDSGNTVTKDIVCFDSNGNLNSNCASNAMPLLRVIVTDPNGRSYATLFAQTRLLNDPETEH